MLVFILIVVVIVFLPQWYVRHTIAKYSKADPEIPGTGGELAQHLIKRFNMEGVSVEETSPHSDHYDPQDKAVRLSPRVFQEKSLTAVAIAAHEVGHAVQYHRNESIVLLRKNFTPIAIFCERFGSWFFIIAPFLFMTFKVPHAMLAPIGIAILLALVSVLMQLIILPMEWDASFNKALPILLEGEYISEEQIAPVRQILKAAAFTYLASAILNVLNVWRLLRLGR